MRGYFAYDDFPQAKDREQIGGRETIRRCGLFPFGNGRFIDTHASEDLVFSAMQLKLPQGQCGNLVLAICCATGVVVVSLILEVSMSPKIAGYFVIFSIVAGASYWCRRWKESLTRSIELAHDKTNSLIQIVGFPVDAKLPFHCGS